MASSINQDAGLEGLNKKMSANNFEPSVDSVASSKPALSRRQFLTKAALGVGLVSMGGRAVASPILPTSQLSITSPEDLMPLGVTCATPTITTRLFASSNKGQNESRNQLSLARLRCAGFDVQNPTVTQRQFLRFAGTDDQRASDLQNIATGAIAAPKLLLGVRGGYGAMRLLPMIDWATLGRIMQEQGTVMAGFSDVTALQCALLAKGGMSSLAAPMAYSEFGKTQPDPISCQGFVEALTNPALTLKIPNTLTQTPAGVSPPLSSNITGTLWGGNLSMVTALAGSDYLPQPDGGIVFLEDVGEQPYRVERMLYSLYLSGAFKSQQAIVLGAFSNIGEDSYDARYDMGEVIGQLQKVTGLPVFTGVPFGHVARKQSFPLGATCSLTTEDDGFTLTFSDYPVIDGSKIMPEALWR